MRSLRTYLAGAFAALLFTLAPALAAGQTITQAGGLFGPSSANCNTLTVSQTCFAVTGVWNNGAITFPGALTVNMTNSASGAGSLLFDVQLGGATRFNVSSTGALNSAGSITANSGNMWLSTNAGQYILGSGADVFLARDAANTLALRNLANAQTLNIYNTTDAGQTVYERGFFGWVSNVYTVGTQAAGGGSARNMRLDAANILFFKAGGTDSWSLSSTGAFLPQTDAVYDLGDGTHQIRNIAYSGTLAPAASAILRWTGRSQLFSTGDGSLTFANNANTNSATITVGASAALNFGSSTFTTSGNYIGNIFQASASGGFQWGNGTLIGSTSNGIVQLQNNGNTQNATITIGASNALTFQGMVISGSDVRAGANVQADSGSLFTWLNRSSIKSPADGNVTLFNNALTSFGLLQFGGSTSSFPAWKRVAANLQARLADDSGYADITAGAVTANGSIGATAYVYTGVVTVAGLVTCNAGAKGNRIMVSDASVVAAGNFGATVAGGGANALPVYCDGATWKIGQANLSPANDNLPPAMREQADRLWSAFG